MHRAALIPILLLALAVPVNFVAAQDAEASGLAPGALERLESLEAEVKRLRVQIAQSDDTALGQPPLSPVGPPQVPPTGGAFVPPAPADELGAQPPLSPVTTQPMVSAEEPATYPTVRVTGFFHLDTAYFNQDDLNEAILGDIENGTAFRRARIAATGNVTEDTSYLLEFDFAQAAPRFADLWLNFEDVPYFGGIRFGRFRVPFGMSSLTSVRNLPFLERPLPFVLSPFRQTGIMAYDVSEDQRMTYAVAGYRYLTDNFGNVFGDSGGWGTATRVTWLPYYEGDDEGLIHVGADYSHNDPARDLVPFVATPEIFIGQNPEFGPQGIDFLPIINVPPFANTGAIPTEQTNLFNLEAAASWGNFVVQSEMRWAVVDQLNGARNTFPGFYAHARYVLTGETIEYIEESGVFGSVIPENPVRWGKRGIGAWEIAARVSHLDLNGELLPGPGRQLTDVTAGLNWYVNRYVKFQFNYIHAFLDDPGFGESDADVYALRGQLEF